MRGPWRHGSVVSTGRSADGLVVLRIRDNGEGLNEKTIEAALQASPPSSSDPWDADVWNAGAWDAGAQTSALALANALAEAEIASEIYSTAGDYDLLVKFYVDKDTDIGHFVNEKVQVIPGIQDTHTIITFKAFGTA